MRHTGNDIAKLAQALEQYMSLLDGVEVWKEQNTALSRLKEISGPMLSLDAIKSENDRDRNVRLRFEVSRIWNEAVAQGNLNLALDLSYWIVRDWGGIRNIKNEVVKRHFNLALRKKEALPFLHISSSSKVFSLLDPKIFQIYDARVAVSLNVMQLAADTGVRLYFKIPPTQIRSIADDEDCFLARLPQPALEELGFVALPENEIYAHYTRLLSRLGVDMQLDPIEVEMALFGLALEFSENRNDLLSSIMRSERVRRRERQLAAPTNVKL